MTGAYIRARMTQKPTRFEALKEVARCFNSQQSMADAFGVTQPTIWRWINQSKQMPAEYVLKAEGLTGVSRHHLRPDLYPLDMAPGPRWYGVDQGANRHHFNGLNFSKGAAA